MSRNKSQINEVFGWPTVHEMRKQLGVSINYAYSLIWSGKIEAQKLGFQWRIPPQAIENYLKRKQAR